jgi:hypothetical protein
VVEITAGFKRRSTREKRTVIREMMMVMMIVRMMMMMVVMITIINMFCHQMPSSLGTVKATVHTITTQRQV